MGCIMPTQGAPTKKVILILLVIIYNDHRALNKVSDDISGTRM